MIKYTTTDIIFQEIPSEISLGINISNCPYSCKGCHSPELQQDIGEHLTKDELARLIQKEKIGDKYLISCVLFMGGDQHIELLDLLKVVKEFDLKAALYTGSDDVDITLKKQLDYLKTGSYVEELGSLKSVNTNQKLVKFVDSVEKIIK